jgi:L-rhamnose isomerase/sugar isomerase
MNVQEAVAKAVFVDQDSLKAAQKSGDVLAAHEVLMDAYNTDVRPMIREWREAKGIDGEPMKAYAKSGYAEKIAAERIGGNQAGWGA